MRDSMAERKLVDFDIFSAYLLAMNTLTKLFNTQNAVMTRRWNVKK